LKVLKKFSLAVSRLKTADQDYFYEQFMYGHREILLAYARSANQSLPPNSIISAGLQHGWAGDANIWRVRNKNLTPATRYVWEKRFEIGLPKSTRNIAIGAPWLYLLDILGIEKGSEYVLKNSSGKKEFLIFPGHNMWNTNKPLTDQASAFYEITKGKSATVCLYWIDYLQPRIRKAYEDLGFKLECVGYLGNPTSSPQSNIGRSNFLLELATLMLNHKTIVADDFSSGVLYGATLGLEVMFMDDERTRGHDEKLSKDRDDSYIGFYSTSNEWLDNFLPEIYLTKEIGRKFIDFSYQELGVESLLTRKELGDIEWIGSNLDEQIQIEFENSVRILRNSIFKLE
jgi:hypothetical protein